MLYVDTIQYHVFIYIYLTRIQWHLFIKFIIHFYSHIFMIDIAIFHVYLIPGSLSKIVVFVAWIFTIMWPLDMVFHFTVCSFFCFYRMSWLLHGRVMRTSWAWWAITLPQWMTNWVHKKMRLKISSIILRFVYCSLGPHR